MSISSAIVVSLSLLPKRTGYTPRRQLTSRNMETEIAAMPLRNRVTPEGEIIATPQRGLFMGNRGGRIHDPGTRTLTRRLWASRQWIICRLQFKNRHRTVMSKGYTELFFLDEVTALAAGHRPCFECRRQDANAFFAAHHAFCTSVMGRSGEAGRMSAAQMDKLLHTERTGDVEARASLLPDELPDGTMFAHQDAAWAKRHDRLLRWTPAGYDRARPLKDFGALQPLTPMTTIGILQFGYEPVWHPGADKL
jgi:hypothetical protein